MLPLAKRSIQPRPVAPSAYIVSALMSPLCGAIRLTWIVEPEKTSTQPVEPAGCPGRCGSLQRFLAAAFRFPEPVDSTRPPTVTAQPSRCTRSEPSPPRLVTRPESRTVRSEEATIAIVPPRPELAAAVDETRPFTP